MYLLECGYSSSVVLYATLSGNFNFAKVSAMTVENGSSFYAVCQHSANAATSMSNILGDVVEMAAREATRPSSGFATRDNIAWQPVLQQYSSGKREPAFPLSVGLPFTVIVVGELF